MGDRKRNAASLATFLTMGVALAASDGMAQSATPGSTVYLDPMSVEGESSETDTARRRLEATPGGVALVEPGASRGRADVNLGDSLGFVPGVVIQNYFGGNDQPRLNIRGSGLQQSPVERGVLTLQDGLPLNRADGAFIAGLANPGYADAIEVYRGYTTNRLGAAVLGGALNFISPTGSTAPGVKARMETGSFGQFNGSLQAGGALEKADGLISYSYSGRDGYRDFNDSERQIVETNGGFDLNDHFQTRFFAGYTDLSFDVPGPVPKDQVKSNPQGSHGGPVVVPGVGATRPGPNVLRDKPQRETTQYRLGNRTTGQFGDHVVDMALGYAGTEDEFRFPVTAGIRETDSDDVTFIARYSWSPDQAEPLPLFESSLRYSIGWANRDYYLNQRGSKGEKFGRNDLDSSIAAFFSGFNIPLGEQFTLSPALTLTHAKLENDDKWGASVRPTYNAVSGVIGSVAAKDNSYSRSYDGFSPSLALSFRPMDDQMVYGALSRSFEPPTQDDLLSARGGTPNSSPTGFDTPDLDAQTATTAEIGWRGKAGLIDLDVGTYYSWIKDEILVISDASGLSGYTRNADQTRHFGIELGGSAQILDDVGLRLAYTYQDFRFHDSDKYGNNRLAGAPSHIIAALARYDVTSDVSLEADVRWILEKTPVDNMNTLYNDPWAVFGLRANWDITEKLTIYGEARNLFDEKYAAASVTLDQASRADQAAFLPADGRAFYMGVKATF